MPADLSDRLVEMSQSYGLNAREIAGVLERARIAAPFGGTRWHPSTVTRALARRGVVLPRGRPPKWCAPRPEVVTPLHVITAMAWRRRAPGSGSDLWQMLPERVEG